MNVLTAQIIAEARRYVGIKETTRNDGPEIREWLRRARVTKPAAWCAAFASCMVDDACKATGVANRLGVTAGARRLIRKAKEIGAWSVDPVTGGVFGIGHPNGLGHVGIVVEIGPTSLVTIEGNTNSEGSREGDCVRIRTRRLGEIDLGYFDPGMMVK